jgi:hypothetical protein
VQLLLDAPLYLPPAQLEQLVAAALLNLLLGQLPQPLAETSALNLPPGQLLQLPAPESQNLPLGQVLQLPDAAAALYFPLGQLAQLLLEAVALYFPTGQLAQVPPVAPPQPEMYLPAKQAMPSHALQALWPAFAWYFAAGQATHACTTDAG